jgi:hypothetical protein
MENTPSFITVLNKWWTNGNEKGFGLNIDCIASQYRPERNYKFLTFEKNAFGYYGKNNSWTPPTGYASYPSTNGIDFFVLVALVMILVPLNMVGLILNMVPMAFHTNLMINFQTLLMLIRLEVISYQKRCFPFMA